MARYIEAEALKKVMCEGCDNKHLCTESPACETVQQIDAQPKADVAPVKHGKWVKLNRTAIHEFDGDYVKYVCSECGRLIKTHDSNEMFINRLFPYCHCGAKMDEVEE